MRSGFDSSAPLAVVGNQPSRRAESFPPRRSQNQNTSYLPYRLANTERNEEVFNPRQSNVYKSVGPRREERQIYGQHMIHNQPKPLRPMSAAVTGNEFRSSKLRSGSVVTIQNPDSLHQPPFQTQTKLATQSIRNRKMSGRLASNVAQQLECRENSDDEASPRSSRPYVDPSNPLNEPEIRRFVQSIGSLLPHKASADRLGGETAPASRITASRFARVPHRRPPQIPAALPGQRQLVAAGPTAGGGGMEPELWRPELAGS